jgi:hypothetical protein
VALLDDVEQARERPILRGVSKVWVLDTSTKGTGASVVPLESTRSAPEPKRVVAPKKRRPKREPEPAPRRPRSFKVVDLVSTETLAEDTGMRATLDVLAEVRSAVDVRIFVWNDEADGWRLLTLAEQRALWDAAHGGRAQG